MKHTMSKLVVLSVAAALSACVSTGAHQLRDPSVAAGYGLGDSTKNVPTERVQLGQDRAVKDVTSDTWWKGFGDERLDRVVARVIEVNTDLASAGFRLRRARLSAGLATDDLIPDLMSRAPTATRSS